MKKTLILLAVSACLAGAAWADDFNPPAWYDDGNPTNTRQAWEFSTNCGSMFPAEEVDNPFGTPCATIGGAGVSWLPAFEYPPVYGLRTGVLQAGAPGDHIEFAIPNQQDVTKWKEVIVLLTVATSNPNFVEDVSTTLTPSYLGGVSGSAQRTAYPVVTMAADGWYYIEDHWAILPQPDCEAYRLELKGSWPIGAGLWLDEAVIYTRCVPEPATLGLLALGGAGILLRRRRS